MPLHDLIQDADVPTETPETEGPTTTGGGGEAGNATSGSDEGTAPPDGDGTGEGTGDTEGEGQHAAAPGSEGTAPPAGVKPEVWEAMRRLALEMKDFKYDLNDPREFAILRRAAEKEVELAKRTKGEGDAAPADELTEFERAAGIEDQPATEKPGADTAQTAGAGEDLPPGKYGDIGDNWKAPRDSYIAEQQAWENGGDPPDYDTLHQIQVARTVRILDAVAGPTISALRQEIATLKSQLSEVAPHVKQTLARNEQAQSRRFAVTELAKVKGFEEVEKLFEEEDGPPVEFGGEKFANTPFNRICKSNPEILNIVVPEDSAEARRAAKQRGITPARAARDLTNISRFRMAARIARQGRVAPAQAQALVDAGAEAAKRQQRDTIRQGLNSGAGTKPGGSVRTPASDGPRRLGEIAILPS
jgi:hypothetical protein